MVEYRPPSIPVVSLEGDCRWCTVAYLNLNNCFHVPVHLDYITFIVPETILMGSDQLSFMLFPYYAHIISLHYVFPCCLSLPYSNCKQNTSPFAAALKIGEDMNTLVSTKRLTKIQLDIRLLSCPRSTGLVNVITKLIVTLGSATKGNIGLVKVMTSYLLQSVVLYQKSSAVCLVSLL